MIQKSDSNLKRLNSSTSTRSPALTFGLQHHFSGETAVKSARDQARGGNYFSVAFIDIEMPGGMNGLQTAERLWEIDPNLHIVICSGQQNDCWNLPVIYLAIRINSSYSKNLLID